MAKFQFVARTSDGQIQRGIEAAASAPAVVAAIRSRGSTVIDVQLLVDQGPTVGQLLGALNPVRYLPVRSVDIETSLSQLSLMLRAGLTLLTALQNVAQQALRPAVQVLWQDVAHRVQQGNSLADALKQHRVFPALVIHLVRIGEQTGNLEQVIARGAQIMERRRHVRNTLLTSLIYPTIVLVSAIGVSVFMILYVIPKLEKFLVQLGRKLPPMTQSLLDISHAVQTYWQEGVTAFVVCSVAFLIAYWSESGRYWIDRLALRVPIVGYLFRLAATALVSRALGILLQSGVTLLEALRTVEYLPANQYLRRVLALARDEVLHGGSLANGLRQSPHTFLPMLPAMIAVGESSGTLDEVLQETAIYHEEQLQVAIRRFSALIEPVIVLVVGGIVGYVYIAFFVALFSVGGPQGG